MMKSKGGSWRTVWGLQLYTFPNICTSILLIWSAGDWIFGLRIMQFQITQFFRWGCTCSTLTGPIITTAWCVLRLGVEQTSSRYGRQLWIYWTCSCGQLTRDSAPVCLLGVGLTSPHQNKVCYKMLCKVSDLNGFFGMTWAKENGREIWHMVCKKLL
jgi:hypothetical protein